MKHISSAYFRTAFHIAALLVQVLISLTLRAQTSSGDPQRYKIAGITVMGTEYTDPQAIKLFSGLREGQEILLPGEDIADAIRLLWKQKLFADVSIYAAEYRGTDVYLVISLSEMPRLGSFGFPGLRKSEAENLREKLALINGTVCNENLKTTAISRIRDYYIEKGYFNVDVKIRETPDPILQDKNYVRLDFLVERGNRVKVGEIILDGVAEINPRRIKRIMKNTKEKAWWRVFKSSKFIEEEYTDDKAKIIGKYNKEGFRNARIIKDSIYPINPGLIGIYMKVDEDKKFYFRNITFAGNTKYSSAALDSVLNIQKGDVYNLEMLSQRIDFNQNGRDISSLYTDDGYLSFYAFPVETLVQPDSIDIEIRLYEGNQFRIGRVAVTGNTKTNDHVIFREIRTRPGDLFNRSDVIRTQRELAALNYFNPQAFDVKMNPREDKGLVDLQYVLEEKPSDQIELSGGWGGGRVVGSLGLSFNNFSMRNIFKKDAWTPLPSGDGQRFSIRAVSNGLFFRSYNLSFTEPWLGGRKPNSLSVSAYRSVQSNGLRRRVNDAPNPAYQSLIINGASVSFGQRWQRPDDWFLFYAGVSYQHFDLNRFGSFFSFNEGFSNNLAINATLERNSVSDPIYPTWGSKITLSTKSTLPYTLIGESLLGREYDYEGMSEQERFDWVEYYKVKFTANWYTSLNRHKTNKFVLHTNVGFGFLGTYNRQLGSSPFERFYLGGVFLSGFLLDGREIVNLRGYDDLSLTTPSDRVGAPLITKYGMELRYPLSTNPSATIFALGFLEAGRTWEDFEDYNPFNLYRSTGMGLRIFLPMFGLLGFDYGWRLDELPFRPNMSRGQFHFSIGMNLGEL